MRMILAVLEGKNVGRRFVFERLPFLIGRTTDCAAVLYHPSVSRHHCRFYENANQIFLEDLRSTNGTFVNNTPILFPVALHPGDIIHLGPLYLRFDILQADAFQPSSEPAEFVQLPNETPCHPDKTTLERFPSLKLPTTPTSPFSSHTPTPAPSLFSHPPYRRF